MRILWKGNIIDEYINNRNDRTFEALRNTNKFTATQNL